MHTRSPRSVPARNPSRASTRYPKPREFRAAMDALGFEGHEAALESLFNYFDACAPAPLIPGAGANYLGHARRPHTPDARRRGAPRPRQTLTLNAATEC
eukprot:2656637-Prymnesium_polylepis.1